MFLIICGFTGGKGKEEADGVLALADGNTLCMGVPGVTWSWSVQALILSSLLIIAAFGFKKMPFMYKFSPILNLLVPCTLEGMCRHI